LSNLNHRGGQSIDRSSSAEVLGIILHDFFSVRRLRQAHKGLSIQILLRGQKNGFVLIPQHLQKLSREIKNIENQILDWTTAVSN
jgi:hypothetical protein